MVGFAIQGKQVPIRSVVVVLLVFLLKAYQTLLSPILHAFGPACRFHPTCSEYARQVLVQDGVWRGFWRTLRRMSKCHPFNSGGFDPP